MLVKVYTPHHYINVDARLSVSQLDIDTQRSHRSYVCECIFMCVCETVCGKIRLLDNHRCKTTVK